jgi:hypothetical protein
MVAPLWPHALQRAHCRSLSLDVSAPQRITGTAHASGAWCGHFSQLTHTHGVARCKSPRVVVAPVARIGGRWIRNEGFGGLLLLMACLVCDNTGSARSIPIDRGAAQARGRMRVIASASACRASFAIPVAALTNRQGSRRSRA